MKKNLLVFLVLTMALTAVLQAETKLKMELWNRYTFEQVDGETTKNQFALQRGYFRLEPKFGANIKGRFNVDFFSSDKDEDVNGAGIKLKYAYLDFSKVLPIEDSKITVGLMKTYFGTIYDWDYTTIQKDPADAYKFVSSTDYGIGVSGYYPNGFGEYAIAVYNGEGYKKAGKKVNTDLAFCLNTRVTPITGVTVGGSYMMNSKNPDEIDGQKNEDREEYSQFAANLKLAYGKFSVLGQLLSKTTETPNDAGSKDETKQAISVMPVYVLSNCLDIVARYDQFDPSTDVDDDAETHIMGGVNYHIQKDAKNNPKLMLQAFVEQVSFEEDGADDELIAMLQLRWIFSHKIK